MIPSFYLVNEMEGLWTFSRYYLYFEKATVDHGIETWWENQRISSFPRLSASLGNSLTSGDMGALDSRKSQGPLGIKISFEYLRIFKREDIWIVVKKMFLKV